MNGNNSELNIPEGIQILIGIVLFVIIILVVAKTTDNTRSTYPDERIENCGPGYTSC